MTQATYIKAYYRDADALKRGLEHLKANGVEILDVLTPFPVHGLDRILGYRRSWIGRVGFIAGAVGAITGFYFQTWIFTKSYPLNIGGKPFLSVPSFVPVTFELSVLFAAFAMVIAFLIRSKLSPGQAPIIHNERITDDLFMVLAGAGVNPTEATLADLIGFFKDSGAEGILVKDDLNTAKNY